MFKSVTSSLEGHGAEAEGPGRASAILLAQVAYTRAIIEIIIVAQASLQLHCQDLNSKIY